MTRGQLLRIIEDSYKGKTLTPGTLFFLNKMVNEHGFELNEEARARGEIKLQRIGKDENDG